LYFCLLSGLVVVAGCFSSPEDDHLEHHVPEHQPPNFPAAIEELIRRLHEFEESAGETEQAGGEFRDIVGWLPELAAHSDLKKREWDAINTHTKRLLLLWEAPPSPLPSETRRETEQLLDQLKQFVSLSSFDNLPGHVLAANGPEDETESESETAEELSGKTNSNNGTDGNDDPARAEPTSDR
jgi:hypothetical protein